MRSSCGSRGEQGKGVRRGRARLKPPSLVNPASRHPSYLRVETKSRLGHWQRSRDAQRAGQQQGHSQRHGGPPQPREESGTGSGNNGSLREGLRFNWPLLPQGRAAGMLRRESTCRALLLYVTGVESHCSQVT